MNRDIDAIVWRLQRFRAAIVIFGTAEFIGASIAVAIAGVVGGFIGLIVFGALETSIVLSAWRQPGRVATWIFIVILAAAGIANLAGAHPTGGKYAIAALRLVAAAVLVAFIFSMRGTRSRKKAEHARRAIGPSRSSPERHPSASDKPTVRA